MRLIDADKLIAIFQKKFGCYSFMIARQDIDLAPTVDAVHVVRCKDCEYYMPWNGGRICARFLSCYRDTNPDDFCSRGVRKNAVD